MNPWEFPIVGGPADPYWADWINRGIDVVGARVGQGRYISPDDPRFRGQFPGGGTIVPSPDDPRFRGQFPGGGTIVPSPGGPAFVPGTVGAQGFQVNWWAAALAGVVLGAFLLGKRGR